MWICGRVNFFGGNVPCHLLREICMRCLLFSCVRFFTKKRRRLGRGPPARPPIVS